MESFEIKSGRILSMNEKGQIKIEPVPPAGFNRAHSRYKLEVPVTAQILFPEETFQPVCQTGSTVDVSLRGLQVYLQNLHQDVYKKMVKTNRYIRLHFHDEVDGEPIKITGRIMWIDYHNSGAESQVGSCYVGIGLNEKESDLGKYTEFFKKIESV